MTPWLMKPGGSMPYSQELFSNLYPSRINPISHIDTYFLKISSSPAIYVSFFQTSYHQHASITS